MSSEIDLDVAPTGVNPQHNVKRSQNTKCPDGYTSYDFKRPNGSFDLNSLLYTKERITTFGQGAAKNVSKVTTYSTSNNILLVIHVVLEKKQSYHINLNGDVIRKDVHFGEFVSVDNKELGKDDLVTLLEEVKSKVFDYESLSERLKNKLWRGSAVIFDLSKYMGLEDGAYPSEITRLAVMVEGEYGTGEFLKVRHTPLDRPFYIKGLKNGLKSISVDGGFPNEPLEGFTVYYNSYLTYDTPLLILLKVNASHSFGHPNAVPGRYLLSKNGGKTGGKAEWDIRRIDGSLQDSDDGFGKLLANIAGGKSLTDGLPEALQKKLIDYTQELVIYLVDMNGESGTYMSNNSRISYKRLKAKPHGFNIIHQASAFARFTVRSINTPSGYMTGSMLPKQGTELCKFLAYYSDPAYKTLVLIELTCVYKRVSGSPKTVYYYCKDGSSWKGYVLKTQVVINGEDLEDTKETDAVITHVKQNDGKIILTKLTDGIIKNKLREYPEVATPPMPKNGPTPNHHLPHTSEHSPHSSEDHSSDTHSAMASGADNSTSSPPDNTGSVAGTVGAIVGSIIGAALLGILGWKMTPVVKNYVARRHSSL